MEKTIVKGTNLKKYFPLKEGLFSSTKENVKAVDKVSIEIKKGETLMSSDLFYYIHYRP